MDFHFGNDRKYIRSVGQMDIRVVRRANWAARLESFSDVSCDVSQLEAELPGVIKCKGGEDFHIAHTPLLLQV